MIYLVDKIANALQNDEYLFGLYLDFSKAFDTVNYKTLLDKLEFYGIRGLALKWLADYLSDGKQFVEYNSCASSYKDITCGVPQGSILGPIFFFDKYQWLSKCIRKNIGYFLQMTLVYFYRAISQMTWFVKRTMKWNISQNDFTLFMIRS